MPVSEKMTPFWSAPGAELYLGDVMGCLRQLPTRLFHCVVTSPPYWRLRDYGTGKWDGGIEGCDHVKGFTCGDAVRIGVPAVEFYKNNCGKCGAIRIDHQIGNEDKLEHYISSLVGVFGEVKRVLRNDGTVWLNLGDTFDDGQQLIPARVALALIASGWRLVQDIIWAKPNPMPEPVTCRFTKSHEHIFLLTKGSEYYFDDMAVQEESKTAWNSKQRFVDSAARTANRLKLSEYQVDRMRTQFAFNTHHDDVYQRTRNKRDVWVIATRPYSQAHFAVFSPELITPCILAGTSEHGCCSECQAPYERVISKTGGAVGNGNVKTRDRSFPSNRNGLPGSGSTLDGMISTKEVVGWRKVCGCQTNEVVPCMVLDPFVGSGTTVATSVHLGRHGVGIDLSEVYLRDNAVPRIEAAMRGENVSRRTSNVPVDVLPIPTRLA